jgi:hypothetical protein
MPSLRISLSLGALLVVGMGCHDGDKADAAPCPGSVAAACNPDSSIACPATWPEAQADRSFCAAGYNESTWECPQYLALRTIFVDTGRTYFYDKTTGELVFVVPLDSIGFDCAGTPVADPLAGCTLMGDCRSHADGGAQDN